MAGELPPKLTRPAKEDGGPTPSQVPTDVLIDFLEKNSGSNQLLVNAMDDLKYLKWLESGMTDFLEQQKAAEEEFIKANRTNQAGIERFMEMQRRDLEKAQKGLEGRKDASVAAIREKLKGLVLFDGEEGVGEALSNLGKPTSAVPASGKAGGESGEGAPDEKKDKSKIAEGLTQAGKTMAQQTAQTLLGPLQLITQPLAGLLGSGFFQGIKEKFFKKRKRLAPTRSQMMSGGHEAEVYQVEAIRKMLGKGEEDETKKGFLDALFGSGTGGIMGMAKSVFPALMKALPFAAIAAGLIWGVIDGIAAIGMADAWGVSKVSAFLGGFLAGTGEGWGNAFKNAGKWALIGVGAGFLIAGPVGALVGGLVGAAVGGILGFFGGAKVAKGLQQFGIWAYDTLIKPAWDFIKAPFLNVWDAIKGIFGDLGEIWKGDGSIIKKIGASYAAIYKGLIKMVGGWLTGLWDIAKKAFLWLFTPKESEVDGEMKKRSGLSMIFDFIVDGAANIIRQFMGGIRSQLEGNPILTKVFDIITWPINFIVDTWVTLKNIVTSMITDPVAFFSKLWAGVTDAVGGFFTFVKDGVVSLATSAGAFATDVWTKLTTSVTGFFSDVWGTVKGVATGAFKIAQDLWDGLASSVTGFFGDLKEGVVGLVSGAITLAKDLWGKLTVSVTGFFTDVKDGIAGMVAGPVEVVKGLWTSMTGIATKFFTDVKAGVESFIADPLGSVKRLWEGATAKAKSFFTDIKASVEAFTSDPMGFVKAAWMSFQEGVQRFFASITGFFDYIGTVGLLRAGEMMLKGTLGSGVDTMVDTKLQFARMREGVAGQRDPTTAYAEKLRAMATAAGVDLTKAKPGEGYSVAWLEKAILQAKDKAIKVDDAIVQPSGRVIRPSADDTIIATKSPVSRIESESVNRINQIDGIQETNSVLDAMLGVLQQILTKPGEAPQVIVQSQRQDAFSPEALLNGGLVSGV